MTNWLFIIGVASLITPLYLWSFRALPKERWQIIAAVPIKKAPDGTWQGLNLTFYGLFNALALISGVGMTIILTGAAGVNCTIFIAILSTLLAICLPASRIIARWVEKKPNTFSIGAASFTGIGLGPWVAQGVNLLADRLLHTPPFETMAVLSALVIGYTLGEGLGRLACISFGCCYGNPIDQTPQWVQHYFSWATTTYSGRTKKIAYAHHLDGEKVVAIPAITAVLYTFGALTGTMLFLNGHYSWAFFFCLLVTQGWRFFSEFLRSDYRGDRKISVYQIMSLLTIPYALLLLLFFPSAGNELSILDGLHLLWNPAVILFLQVLGILMFLRTGRSQTTGSGLSFHVNHDRI
jgi:hypothetical protein